MERDAQEVSERDRAASEADRVRPGDGPADRPARQGRVHDVTEHAHEDAHEEGGPEGTVDRRVHEVPEVFDDEEAGSGQAAVEQAIEGG